MADIVGEVAVRVVADAGGLNRDVEDKAEEAGERASRAFSKSWEKDQNKQDHFRVLRKQADDSTRSLSRFFRRLGTRGSAFGIVTSAIAEMIDLARTAARFVLLLGEVFVEVFKTIATQVREATKSMEGFGRNLGTVIASLIEAAASVVGLVSLLAALALAINVVVVAAGLLVAAISAIAGLLTIMGAGLAYAASGALVFGPALLSIGAAAGAVMLGMQGVTGAIGAFVKAMNETDPEKRAEALKKYAEALAGLSPSARATVIAMEPLIRQFQGIRAMVQEHLFAGLADDMAKLQPVLRVIGGGLTLMADAVNNVVENFIALISTKQNLDLMRETFAGWAGIFESLGKAAGEFLVGLLSFFNAVNPTAQRFADAMQRIGERFREWAASAGGQNAIKKFMDEAYLAASTVWKIIVELGKAVAVLFSGGKEEGQGFLDSILSLVTRFREWLEEIKGDGTLDRWFQRAIDFGKSLGKIIGAVAKLFDALDTPAVHTVLNILLTTFAAVIDTIARIAQLTQVMFDGIGAAISGIGSAIAAVPGVIGSIGSAIAGFAGSIGGFLSAVAGGIGSVLSSIGSVLSSVFGAIWGFISGLASAVATALQPFTQVIAAAFGVLVSLASTVAQLMAIPFQLLWKVAEPIIRVLMSLVQEGLSVIAGWATAAAGLIADGFMWLVGAFQWVWDKIAAGARWAIDGIARLFSWVGGVIAKVASSIFAPFKASAEFLYDIFKWAVDGVVGLFEWLRDVVTGILDWVTSKLNWIKDKITAIPGFVKGIIPGVAAGGLFATPTRALIGEAGPEAVIPLARPLSMIDPSVRGMAAALRGQAAVQPKSMPQRVFNADITVNSPMADPSAVAAQVVNRMAVMAGA